jgi:hypothetical protein
MLSKMNYMKILLNAIIFMIVLSFVLPPANAQDTVLKDEWTMPAPPMNIPSQGILFMDPPFYPRTSYLEGYRSKSMNTEKGFCKTVNTEFCVDGVDGVIYNAVIPVCSNAESRNCIEDFWLVLNGKKLWPKFDSYMPAHSALNFQEDVGINLPEGKSSSIWRIKVPQIGQTDLLFAVSAIFSANTSSVQIYPNERRFGKPDISIEIDPVEKSTFTLQHPPGTCAAVDADVCAKRINNIEGIRYGIKIRITDPPITWVHGRLLNAEFTTLSFNSGATWSIEAEPATLPVTSSWISNSDYEEMKGYKLASPNETILQGPYSGTRAFIEFSRWLPFLGEKAQVLQKRWRVESIYGGQRFNGKSLEDCLKPNAIAGVVMSNATVYQSEPPSWNERDLTLDYKVAAPHLTPNGDEYLGVYQLKINSEFARCIYGFQNVPLVATISVVGDKGTIKIATSSMTFGTDWINFNVSGFTFSTPTIKIQLSEAKKPVVPKAFKKSSITCIKGKTTKKVTGLTPKCPAGYKKK